MGCAPRGDSCTTVVVAAPGAISFAVRLPRHAAQHAAAPQNRQPSGATTNTRITTITMAANAPEASAFACAAKPAASAPYERVDV